MGRKKREVRTTIVLQPNILNGADLDEVTKLDVAFESSDCRLIGIEDIAEKRSAMPRKTIQDAFNGDNKKSEKIAKWLRAELAQLRAEESKASTAPVVTGTCLGRATISDMAITLLSILNKVGSELCMLLAELLDVDRHRRNLSKDKAPLKYICALVDSQNPGIGVRELAEVMGVVPSTIYRWRRDRSYQDSVENYGPADPRGSFFGIIIED